MQDLAEALLIVGRLLLEDAQGSTRPVTQLKLKTAVQDEHDVVEMFHEEWHQMELGDSNMGEWRMKVKHSHHTSPSI